jgi:hypothetical protein
MNTRGLVELIALNIGLQLNIFSPRLFTMFIIMALVTTFLTCPLLWLVYLRKNKSETLINDDIQNNKKVAIGEKYPRSMTVATVQPRFGKTFCLFFVHIGVYMRICKIVLVLK